MTSYDRVMELCKKNNVKPTAVEKELGFGRGSIGKMKQFEMKYDRLKSLAAYFNVTVSYLRGETDVPYETTSNMIDKYDFLRTIKDDTSYLSQGLVLNSLVDKVRPTKDELDMIIAYRHADEREQAIVNMTLRLKAYAQHLSRNIIEEQDKKKA